jgi:hypothetical protein
MYSRLSQCVGHPLAVRSTLQIGAPGGGSAARHALLDWTPRIAAPQTHNVLMLCDWGAAMCPMSSEAWRAVDGKGAAAGRVGGRLGLSAEK